MRILLLIHKDLKPPLVRQKLKDIENLPCKTEHDVYHGLCDLGHDVHILGIEKSLEEVRQKISSLKPHVVFNLVENFTEEGHPDHNLVSYMETLGVKHTGCSAKGLLISRDKALSKKILKYHNILTPDFFTIAKESDLKRNFNCKYPAIVKLLKEDASLGISQKSIVKKEEELRERAQFLWKNYGSSLIVEDFIEGREIYVSILGHHHLKSLTPWELFFGGVEGNKVATYKAKWDLSYRKKHGIRAGKAKNLEPKLEKKLLDMARKTYRCLDLNGYARIDFRVTKKGEIYVLEVNPNPDIGYGEEMADAAKFEGISYEQLLSKIIDLALCWNAEKAA